VNVIPRLFLALTIVLVPAVVYATTAGLPPRIATHFGNGGVANGFMSHDGYLLFMLCFTTLLPLAVVGLVGFVPGIAASSIKGPARDFWLAHDRRHQSLAWIGNHACWLGVLLSLFLLGMHLLTVQANELVPPRLSEASFFPLLGAFVAGMGLWVAVLVMHFRSVR
jgi:hypothetical protein